MLPQKEYFTRLFILLFQVLLLGACTSVEETVEQREEPITTPEGSKSSSALGNLTSGRDVQDAFNRQSGWIEETLLQMTLEEKTAQMIMPGIHTSYMSRDSESYQTALKYVEEFKVGGLMASHGDVFELATMTNELQKASETPLLISSDFERGVPMRIRRGTLFPMAMAVGASGDPRLAYRMGKVTAEEGRAMGVHYNFAPVADVNNNPDNPVINVRSFGEDPELVGEMAAAYNRGLHDGGMLSTGKHFPGHGDTDMDSHVALPEIPYGQERLEELELKPFRKIVEEGATSIMSAHIALPEFTGSHQQPATLSPEIMTGLIREDLNFGGLLITDSMGMYGINRNYDRGEAAVMAVQAGMDIVLNPPEPQKALEAIIAAVRIGEIEEERIDRSVRRILSAKKLTGLHQQPKVDLHEIRDVVGNERNLTLADEIAERSLTLVRNEEKLFPLDPEARENLLVISLADRENQQINIHRHNNPSTSEPVGLYFNYRFGETFGNFTTAHLDPRSNEPEIDTLMTKAEKADKILIHSYVSARSGAGDLGLPEHLDKALQNLAESDTPVGVVSFGDPYFIRAVPEIDAYMCAWSVNDSSAKSAVKVLAGKDKPQGSLPIEIPGYGNIGHGLHYETEDNEEEADGDEIPEE